MTSGSVLIAGGAVAGLGPIALVCGVLLVWSGIVKAIVLRIWHTTLSTPSALEHDRHDGDSGTTIGQRT